MLAGLVCIFGGVISAAGQNTSIFGPNVYVLDRTTSLRLRIGLSRLGMTSKVRAEAQLPALGDERRQFMSDGLVKVRNRRTLLQGYFSNIFDLVHEASFLASQFNRGGGRCDGEGYEASAKVGGGPCGGSGANMAEAANALSIVELMRALGV